MNTKDLSGIAIVIRMKLLNTAGKQITTLPGIRRVIDRESRLIPRKIKEIIHSLKNPNHINKISYRLPEIWLPNLDGWISPCCRGQSLSDTPQKV